MSTIRINITLAVIFLAFISGVFGQENIDKVEDPWPEIIEALGSGDAETLALHFSSMIDLGLPEKDDSYSKSQGEIIMRDFFKKYPAKSFKMVKNGVISETSHFAICHYQTSDAEYQVSIHLQCENKKRLITKIKFEEQDL